VNTIKFNDRPHSHYFTPQFKADGHHYTQDRYQKLVLVGTKTKRFLLVAVVDVVDVAVAVVDTIAITELVHRSCSILTSLSHFQSLVHLSLPLSIVFVELQGSYDSRPYPRHFIVSSFPSLPPSAPKRSKSPSNYLGVSVDVGQVSGDTGGVDNVVEGEVGDQRGLLEEERQGLSDTAGSTENGNPRIVGGGKRRERGEMLVRF
jgi:hypothetical protein